jgi:hypothetical protein
MDAGAVGAAQGGREAEVSEELGREYEHENTKERKHEKEKKASSDEAPDR